jgi:hypothetical protein
VSVFAVACSHIDFVPPSHLCRSHNKLVDLSQNLRRFDGADVSVHVFDEEHHPQIAFNSVFHVTHV